MSLPRVDPDTGLSRPSSMEEVGDMLGCHDRMVSDAVARMQNCIKQIDMVAQDRKDLGMSIDDFENIIGGKARFRKAIACLLGTITINEDDL